MTEDDKPRMGRPPAEIDFTQLRALMQYKPNLDDTASFFKVTTRTIENVIRRNTKTDETPEGLTFFEFRSQNMMATKIKLIKKALDMADAGNVRMLTLALKNMCEWAEKFEHSQDPTKPLNPINGPDLSALTDEDKARIWEKLKNE